MPRITTVVLLSGRRQGRHTSAGLTLALLTREARVSAQIAESDYTDRANSLGVEIFDVTDPNPQNWKHIGGFGWTGGAYTNKHGEQNPDPDATLQSEGLPARTLRLEVDIPRSMTMSVSIDAVS